MILGTKAAEDARGGRARSSAWEERLTSTPTNHNGTQVRQTLPTNSTYLAAQSFRIVFAVLSLLGSVKAVSLLRRVLPELP